MPLVEHDDVIEKFSALGLNLSFYVGALPWQRGCRDDLVDTQTLNPPRNALTVYATAVSNQITRSSIKRKRFDSLLRGPLCRLMFRHIEVNNSPSVVGKHDKDEQHPKSSRRDDEKVDRYEISNMLVEECSPRRRRRPGSLGSILLDCWLGNVDSKHREFSDDLWRAPGWIGFPHPHNIALLAPEQPVSRPNSWPLSRFPIQNLLIPQRRILCL